jgi:hypothetical protein
VDPDTDPDPAFQVTPDRVPDPDTDPEFWWSKMEKKIQVKLSTLKREHPALQKLKFINCFLFLGVIFVLLDPKSGSGYRSGDPIESGYGSISTTLYNCV